MQDELYEASKRLCRSEALHADLMMVVQDDLNQLARDFERHRSEIILPKAAAISCTAIAVGLYVINEGPAAALFGMLAAIATVIGIIKADTMGMMGHRIFKIEERLISRGHGVEWTKKRDPSEISVATVICKHA